MGRGGAWLWHSHGCLFAYCGSLLLWMLAFARVKARGGSCWGVEEAAECERLLGERYPGK